MPRKLLIVGASARAAAESARRAGFDVEAADLFGDVDLLAAARTTVIADYRRDLPDVLRNSSADAWLYTGGLENHPRLIDRLARSKPLWGIGGEALRKLRDPMAWSETLRRAGIPTPSVAVERSQLAPGTWIEKPRSSCAGRSVRLLEVREAELCTLASGEPTELTSNAAEANFEPTYWQQFIAGEACGALFVARADGYATLVGVSRQLIGLEWLGAGGFQYCGSVGPLPVSADVRDQLITIGNRLTDAFNVRGLFGVDFILDADDRAWPIEINPRYTASAEVLERALQVPLIAWHAATFDGSQHRNSSDSATPRHNSQWFGKAIVYATRDLVSGNLLDSCSTAYPNADAATLVDDRPTLADIPRPGTAISTGWPIATVFASAADEATLIERLRGRATELYEFIARQAPSA
ncbi:MAG: ATP-grasp domain-containing protein [Planctomycetales bacterium]|nr:ATP-grasp domain-containing protein [Planctomycetales bacterium]